MTFIWHIELKNRYKILVNTFELKNKNIWYTLNTSTHLTSKNINSQPSQTSYIWMFHFTRKPIKLELAVFGDKLNHHYSLAKRARNWSLQSDRDSKERTTTVWPREQGMDYYSMVETARNGSLESEWDSKEWIASLVETAKNGSLQSVQESKEWITTVWPRQQGMDHFSLAETARNGSSQSHQESKEWKEEALQSQKMSWN